MYAQRRCPCIETLLSLKIKRGYVTHTSGNTGSGAISSTLLNLRGWHVLGSGQQSPSVIIIWHHVIPRPTLPRTSLEHLVQKRTHGRVSQTIDTVSGFTATSCCMWSVRATGDPRVTALGEPKVMALLYSSCPFPNTLPEWTVPHDTGLIPITTTTTPWLDPMCFLKAWFHTPHQLVFTRSTPLVYCRKSIFYSI